MEGLLITGHKNLWVHLITWGTNYHRKITLKTAILVKLVFHNYAIFAGANCETGKKTHSPHSLDHSKDYNTAHSSFTTFLGHFKDFSAAHSSFSRRRNKMIFWDSFNVSCDDRFALLFSKNSFTVY